MGRKAFERRFEVTEAELTAQTKAEVEELRGRIINYWRSE